MYKVETHLHTAYCSTCGQMEAREIVEAYAAAGYSGLAVTDHFNRDTFRHLGVDLNAGGDKITPFLEGFRRVQEEARCAGIRVFQGAELRFDECMNDYLLFGWDASLLADPEAVFRMGIAAFSALARRSGALLIQAHPYRHACTPAIACYLDGIEVVNGNPRHRNHNSWAKAYAKEFGLIALSGSDCHQPEDVAAAGILTEQLPQDTFSFAQLIRRGDYRLIDRTETEESY